MGRGNRMTEDKYNGIKAMLRGGAPVEAAATYSGTSKKTVLTVKRTVDYAEYDALRAAASERAKAMTQTPAQKAAPAAVPDNADLLQKLDDMHALLLRLSGAVEKIVADLYGVG